MSTETYINRQNSNARFGPIDLEEINLLDRAFDLIEKDAKISKQLVVVYLNKSLPPVDEQKKNFKLEKVIIKFCQKER